MRESGIGVLEEGDKQKPVVELFMTGTYGSIEEQLGRAKMTYPKIGEAVDAEDVGKAKGVRAVSEEGQPDRNTDIGDQNEGVLVGSEERSFRNEVYRCGRSSVR